MKSTPRAAPSAWGISRAAVPQSVPGGLHPAGSGQHGEPRGVAATSSSACAAWPDSVVGAGGLFRGDNRCGSPGSARRARPRPRHRVSAAWSCCPAAVKAATQKYRSPATIQRPARDGAIQQVAGHGQGARASRRRAAHWRTTAPPGQPRSRPQPGALDVSSPSPCRTWCYGDAPASSVPAKNRRFWVAVLSAGQRDNRNVLRCALRTWRIALAAADRNCPTAVHARLTRNAGAPLPLT